MLKLILSCVVLAALPGSATERVLDFSAATLDQPPPGFHSTAIGPGQPGQWIITLDETAPALEPLSSKAPLVARRTVLAHPARNPAEGNFLMLLLEDGEFANFKFDTRFKVQTNAEQIAGIVFHFLNESNFYVAQADAAAGKFQCFKVADGDWKNPFGQATQITPGTWHELSVDCEGPRILCLLNGTNAIKLLDPAGNRAGKVGFWTSRQTACCFADASLVYREKERPAQKLVQQIVRDYPRLPGLQLYAMRPDGTGPAIVASHDPQEIGQPGGKTEEDVIRQGTKYFARSEGKALVTVPLRDRNGEPIAAIRVILKSFPGQTQENALARSQSIVQKMNARALSLQELLE